MTLSPDDFRAFFQEVHGHQPFPWQERLLRRVAEEGAWPGVLDLPTGSGKTAAIDIAVFHLALESGRGESRQAAVRIALVVDRRLVVDDAFTRAEAIAHALSQPRGPVSARVAEHLQTLAGDGPPLVARRLRGGIPRDHDWARSPAQPTVLCSTVDQVGSRLLFRGYGISDSMKPVHAGLIGSDCLILLDEAHLAEPFRQTLAWVRIYQGRNWREVDSSAPWGVALLTATPGAQPQSDFSLSDADTSHPVLKKRLEAGKPARLIEPPKSPTNQHSSGDEVEPAGSRGDIDVAARASRIVEQVRRAMDHFRTADHGATSPAIAVVVNRVARARAVFARVRADFADEIVSGTMAEPVLMIGPARPVDRDALADALQPIRTRTWKDNGQRPLERPLIVVATQCIEAGVDIDLDALITEAAPLDALRQRFGRLNRAGRDIVPYAAIIAERSDIAARHDDPVYGDRIKPAWDRLLKAASMQRRERMVDFGINAFDVPIDAEALSPKADAPVLMPAHLDLLSQTAPIPAADPDVALYLHGPAREPDSVTVLWRADIDPEVHDSENIRRLLMVVSPRSLEAIELPLWAVRRWLMAIGSTTKDGDAEVALADAPAAAPRDEPRGQGRPRQVFRWRGDDERSRWIDLAALRPGDTVVVPAAYGGVDAYGWNPGSENAASDVARRAAEPFAGRRFAVRVAPGVLGEAVRDEALADALAAAASQRWQDLRAVLLALELPVEIRADLHALDHAKGGKVVAHTDLYGDHDEGGPRGIVFVARFGLKGGSEDETGRGNATEDDAAGSTPGFRLTLAEHSGDVQAKADGFARAAGLAAARVVDLGLAGYLHDAGKADARFQAWLQYGDPLGPDPDDPGQVLAKSDRPLPRSARGASGLPDNWRHEALSVRLAPHIGRFAEAKDPELVLWLLGTHHGHGRPFFPHRDPDDAGTRGLPEVLGLPAESPPGPGPQSLAFDWNGLDWAALFARLKARYGPWELARMEAILRLADHRASEDRASREAT